MTTIDTTDWLLVVKDEEVQYAFLRVALKSILPEVHTVHATNVITALSYLQACLIEQRPLPRLILSDLYLSLQPEGFHLVGTIDSTSAGMTHLYQLLTSSLSNSVDQPAIPQAEPAYMDKPSVFTEVGGVSGSHPDVLATGGDVISKQTFCFFAQLTS